MSVNVLSSRTVDILWGSVPKKHAQSQGPRHDDVKSAGKTVWSALSAICGLHQSALSIQFTPALNSTKKAALSLGTERMFCRVRVVRLTEYCFGLWNVLPLLHNEVQKSRALLTKTLG